MKKRKNGEGSYGERNINGIKYKYFKFTDGHFVYDKTSKGLEAKKEKYQENLKAGKIVVNNMTTFDDYCVEWLKTRKNKISDRLYDDYESIIDVRIKRYDIGCRQIANLTVDMFNDYFIELTKKYSKASIDKTYILVKQVLQFGMKNKKIPQLDISEIIRPKETQVKVKKKHIPYMCKEDMELFEKEVATGKYGDGSKVLVFICHSGLRISEAVGLTWKCVEKDYSCIHISESRGKTVERDENLEPIMKDGKKVYKHVQNGTKSEDGERIIPLSQTAQDILKYFKKKYGNKPDDFVFISKVGKPYSKRTIERTLTRILANSECSRKDYTPHCLRHGFGSILIQKGVDIKIVSEMLGHSDVSFTYNTYIGTSQEDKKNAIKSVFG